MTEVSRIVHRRAKPGCDEAYQRLARAMLEASSQFPGYISAVVIPPKRAGQEFHIVQRFASEEDLDRWTHSDESGAWHERLCPVVEAGPEYRLLSGRDLWCAPEPAAPGSPPAQWRLAVVTWLGIYPVVALCLWLVLPLLEGMPYLLKIAVLTIMVVVAMSYVIMPRLVRWMGWWLRQ